MLYFTYILQSRRDGTYYVGHTSNLEQRLLRHNQGRNVYTRNKCPWMLLYQEAYRTKAEAMRREHVIKAKKSRAYIDSWLERPELDSGRLSRSSPVAPAKD